MVDKLQHVIIGVGERLRGDDAAGLITIDHLRLKAPKLPPLITCGADPGTIVEALEQATSVTIIDAVKTGRAKAGTVHFWDVTKTGLPIEVQSCSTHMVGLAQSLELARALGAWPEKIHIYGIESADFAFRDGPSDEVKQGAREAANTILEIYENA